MRAAFLIGLLAALGALPGPIEDRARPLAGVRQSCVAAFEDVPLARRAVGGVTTFSTVTRHSNVSSAWARASSDSGDPSSGMST